MSSAAQPLEISAKAGLIVVSSPRAHNNPSSVLLRFVRDYVDVITKYGIHATAETANAILGTGLYLGTSVTKHRAGPDGGIAQLAAMATRRECVAALIFLDPNDAWSDAVENRALTRVCIHRHIRLVTTNAAAIRWATFEAELPLHQTAAADSIPDWKPYNWKDGFRNVTDEGEFKPLPVQERSIALIAHDKKKVELIKFLNDGNRQKLLAQHDRILATGTTGWLLKLLFCEDPSAFTPYLEDLEHRLSTVVADILNECGLATSHHEGFWRLLTALRKHLRVQTHEGFAKKVIPLPSGPHGGDVLAADEVVKNTCHEIIFFHDPLTAHPHNDDIRLLEHVCRLPHVFAECVSDKQSAEKWMTGLGQEVDGRRQLLGLAQQVRQTFRLKEVVLVDTGNNVDSPELGTAIARACAGFLNGWLCAEDFFPNNSLRIGVAWGWGMREVLAQVCEMETEGLLEKPKVPNQSLVWSPIIGIITAEMTDEEASSIALGFRNFYGGEFEGFTCAGFAPVRASIPINCTELLSKLRNADLIVTSASAWDEHASLALNTGLDIEKFPPFASAVGTISGIFLEADGTMVEGKYSVVGLGYEDLRQAAQQHRVVLLSGGDSRNKVVLAALRARLVSVLITSRQTAEWICKQSQPITTASARTLRS